MDKEAGVVAVAGLGYVGLQLAVAFGARQRTIGYDLSARKVASYREGMDPTGEVSKEQLRAAQWLSVSCDPAELTLADFIIIAVPYRKSTRLNSSHTAISRIPSSP